MNVDDNRHYGSSRGNWKLPECGFWHSPCAEWLRWWKHFSIWPPSLSDEIALQKHCWLNSLAVTTIIIVPAHPSRHSFSSLLHIYSCFMAYTVGTSWVIITVSCWRYFNYTSGKQRVYIPHKYNIMSCNAHKKDSWCALIKIDAGSFN